MSDTPEVTPGHVHVWEPVGVVPEDNVAYSPVSAMDHQVQTVQVAIRSCECGALRRTIVSRGPWRWLHSRGG